MTSNGAADGPVIFAHLHSSPLVVRRRIGSEWRSLSSKSLADAGSASPSASPSSSAAPSAAEPAGLDGASSSGLEPVDIIDVKEERKLLVQCLHEAKKQIVWHTEVADLHTFRKVLSFGCRVLHFSGHGVPGKVLFENKKCEAQFISQQELKDLLLAGGMEMCRPSDGKIGAMDGVGEKIIHVDPLPPVDAALLFTLRAPRRLKAHEMGGTADLRSFAEHPIIRSLHGHPRTICAVAQFLELKDMEIDKHEFLSYIIPSVNLHSTLGSPPTHPPQLETSMSVTDLTLPKQHWTEPYVQRLADHIRPILPQDEDGRFVWANAVVTNTAKSGGASFDGGATIPMPRLQAMQNIPLEWLAPFISRHFATKLRSDAVKRPLSVRSIDFLSKSALVWGIGSAPAQRDNKVSIEMFANFWRWFAPLTECIAFSRLWAYTQPRLLHGFLSKGACVAMLQHAPPGTFLLRFSETRQRCVVIVYVTDQRSVQFVPVSCQPHAASQSEQGGGGGGGWFISLQDKSESSPGGVTFATLPDLILSVTVLKFLFPQTPKEVAFLTSPK
ncbi:hypothetical protein P43SY_007947 [Pythium insidiosum]|uniref:SH2 domain-containing protein n=1 Tax=Pythium insidiosum TaxID=114742 RepID=A0AAD5LWI6_PYTIN|nr:hypothetical protein P43SY_007947 [Pythium insidiosum]